MKKNEKKVVLLIVEGDSEEALLFERLRELFGSYSIRFKVYNGDVLYDPKTRKPIKSVVGDVVKEFINRYRLKTSDLLAVLHIIDTDGCLISGDQVVINEEQVKNTMYSQEFISVKNENQQTYIRDRNKKRSQNVHVMRTAKTILPSNINYRMYYFSRNLEHVIFDDANPEQEKKVSDVENFVDELEEPIEEILSTHMNWNPVLEYNANYEASWSHICEGTASLQRNTNVPLLIEYIEISMEQSEIIKKESR